jgi:hypothetical protein
MTRTNALQQRQAFSLPFLNAEFATGPTLQPPPGNKG